AATSVVVGWARAGVAINIGDRCPGAIASERTKIPSSQIVSNVYFHNSVIWMQQAKANDLETWVPTVALRIVAECAATSYHPDMNLDDFDCRSSLSLCVYHESEGSISTAGLRWISRSEKANRITVVIC